MARLERSRNCQSSTVTIIVLIVLDLVLAFTRYCHHQYCVVYGIKGGGSVGGRILRNGRAIVLQ